MEGFLYGSNIIFTLDSGADISIVPIEVVPSIFKTERVKKIRGYDNSVRTVETAEIEIDIGGFKLKREAGLLSFADIECTAILSFDNFDRKNHDIYNDLMELKRSQPGCTIPIESGVVHCTKPERSCKDSGGEKVLSNKETSDDSVHSEFSEMFEDSAEIKSESNSCNTNGSYFEESPCNMKEMSVEKGQKNVVDRISRQDEIDYCVLGSGDDVLAKAEVEGENLGGRSDDVLVKAEVEGENMGGRAEYEEQELVKNLKLKNCLEVSELKKHTRLCESLETCRKLAEDNRQGYFCKDNVLMRSRMNDIGEQAVQIVVPKSHRDRILTLSHEKYGHFGHKKMLVLIKRSFFWPGMGRDCKYHARSCKICQKSN